MKTLLIILSLCILFQAGISAQGVYIKPGGVVVSTNTTITVKQNWSNNGTYIQNSGSLCFTGSNQTIGGASNASFNNITMASGDSGVILLKEITVNNQFSLLSGKCVIGNNKLTLNGTISGTGRLVGSLQSDISIGGAGDFGTLLLDSSADRNANALRNIIINRTGNGLVTLGTPLYLTGELTPQAGTLLTNGLLTLCSDSGGTARVSDATNFTFSGNVNAERFITAKAARKWVFVSAAVNSVSIKNGWQDEIFITGAGTGGTVCAIPHTNGFDATTSGSPSMYYYNQTAPVKWQSVAGTINTDLVAGKGYRLLVRGNRNSPNACTDQLNSSAPPLPAAVILNAAGTLTQGDVPVTVHGGNKGYTLLGNPYACELNFSEMHENNALIIANKYWSYDPATPGTNYLTYSDGTVTGCPSNIITMGLNGNSHIIASGQAFFVESLHTTDTILTFKQAYKTSQVQQGVFKTNEWKHRIRCALNKEDGSYLDDVVIRFDDDLSITVTENRFDAITMNSGNMVASLKGSKSYAIQTRPLTFVTDTVNLRIGVTAAGTYKLKFSEFADLSLKSGIKLIDNFTNNIVDVISQPAYAFDVTTNAASQGTGRFRLVFNEAFVLTVNWISVTAARLQDHVQLNWKTTTTEPVEKFEVWRSDNGYSFYKIGEVNSGTVASYSYKDSKPINVKVFYYIRAVYASDKYINSSVIQLSSSGITAVVYPNPVKDILRYQVPGTSNVNMIIKDPSGRVFLRKDKLANSGEVNISVLPAGAYIVVFIMQEGSHFKKIIKQ